MQDLRKQLDISLKALKTEFVPPCLRVCFL